MQVLTARKPANCSPLHCLDVKDKSEAHALARYFLSDSCLLVSLYSVTAALTLVIPLPGPLKLKIVIVLPRLLIRTGRASVSCVVSLCCAVIKYWRR